MAERLRAVRQQRGLTLSQLESSLAQLGRPIQLSTLSKIEKGQRLVNVDDLMALSLALDVPPNLLLLPANAAVEKVQLTHDRSMSGSQAWRYATDTSQVANVEFDREDKRKQLDARLEIIRELGKHGHLDTVNLNLDRVVNEILGPERTRAVPSDEDPTMETD
jgi:transcriptional regulator with XRE-family HTH domain